MSKHHALPTLYFNSIRTLKAKKKVFHQYSRLNVLGSISS